MDKRIKMLVATLVMVSTTGVSGLAHATVYNDTDKIGKIVVSDTNLSARPWLTVVGFTSAGSCATESGTGLVILKMHDDAYGRQQLQIALAAFLAGKDVRVTADDAATKDGSWCYLRTIELD